MDDLIVDSLEILLVDAVHVQHIEDLEQDEAECKQIA